MRTDIRVIQFVFLPVLLFGVIRLPAQTQNPLLKPKEGD